MKHIKTLETWKDIAGYEGLYQVSDLGRVKSLARIDFSGHKRKEKILKPRKTSAGYFQVTLYKNGKSKELSNHRLVAEAFIPNPENLPEVNHCNEKTTDNKAFNLNWVSAKENSNYGTRNERVSKANGKRVRCIETGIVYLGTRDAERKTGTNQSDISKVCRGEKKLAGGFCWEYVNAIQCC